MITAEFDHHTPRALPELLALLTDSERDAKVVAGGMTLVPMLSLGLLHPTRLIGLRGLPELTGITEREDAVEIGAMTRHEDIARDPVIRRNAPLLSLSAALIGDVQVRNRGTIGGSLAHADPAANYLPAVVASDATLQLAGPRGGRLVPARDFLLGVMTTALAEDEIIVSVHVPKAPARRGAGFQKFARVKGNFPIVCAAAMVDPGRHRGQVAVGGATATPVMVPVERPDAADTRALARVGDAIRAAIVDPLEDQNGDAEYKREMAAVFGVRALVDACRAQSELEQP